MRRLLKAPRTMVRRAGPAKLVAIGLAVAAAISCVAMATHGKKHRFGGTTYTINFSLSQGYTTSAGIFNSQGNLVRTLWGNQPMAAGTYIKNWDGNDDFGNALPTGSYSVKLLTHNITANWDGVIGNSSTYHTGTTHLNGYGGFTDVTCVGSEVYMLREYNEGGAQISKFNRATPGQYTTSGQNAIPIAYWPSSFSTDGTRMYVGMEPSGDYTQNPNGMVMAYNLDEVTGAWTFTGINPISGTNQGQNNNGQYLVMGNNTVTSAAFPTSLAVQTGGSFLAVAQAGLNQVVLYDKLAGTPITGNQGYLSVPGVTAIRWSPDNKTLWTSAGTNVVGWQYNGSAWVSTYTINGTQHVRSFNVNPLDGSVAILYSGTDQQLRAYTPMGTWLYTVGARGGYATSPAVNDTKFMILNDTPSFEAIGAGVGFENDGKVWIVDGGNNRMLRFPVHRHLAEARKDAEVRMITGYDLAVDQNNPDRMIIDGYLEFQRDYTQPLSAGEGQAWTLVNNWGYGYIGGRLGQAVLDGITEVVSAPNGHIYGIFEPNSQFPKRDLVELTSSGIRDIGPYADSNIHADMSSWFINPANNSTSVTQRTLQGYDSSNNPIWSSPVQYCSFPSGSGTAGYAAGVQPVGGYPCDLLPDGSFVSFNTSANPSNYSTYYLGYVKPGASNFWAQTASSEMGIPLTHDGHLAIGLIPGVTYPDFAGRTNGDFVAMFANGEFFDESQLCQILLYHKSGLPVLDIGTRSLTGVNNTASSGMAGNAASSAFVTCSDGLMRILHSDESNTGGVHEWTLENTSSLTVASATFDGTNTANFGTAAITPGVITPGVKTSKPAGQSTLGKVVGGVVTGSGSPQGSGPGTTTILDTFGRGNSPTVGNGWLDLNSSFDISNSMLQSTGGHAAEFTNFLMRPETGTDSDQTVVIPAQFSTSILWNAPNLYAGSYGCFSRYQADGSRYFVEAIYMFYPNNTVGISAANGIWQVNLGMFVGGKEYILAAEHGYYLPAMPGHSYSIEMQTTGIGPTHLHVVMTDLVTGQRYVVLDQTSDEPSLQASGNIGVESGFSNSLFTSYSATISNASQSNTRMSKLP